VLIQVLKTHYRAGRIISSVSTAKVPLVPTHLPGLVDQLVDYTAAKRLTDVISRGSVDVVVNTQNDLLSLFPLVNPKTGVMVSISSVPTPELFRQMAPTAPFWVFWVLAVAHWYIGFFKLRGTGIKYTFGEFPSFFYLC